MQQKLSIGTIKSILGMSGGFFNMTLDNNDGHEKMSNMLSGGKARRAKKSKIKSQKSMYREYLNKKYSKNQLLKKCKELGIKVTTRKNGMIKPIKKETLVNKIVKIKFN